MINLILYVVYVGMIMFDTSFPFQGFSYVLGK